MIDNYKGGKFVGSAILSTSVANAEIVPNDLRLVNMTLQTDQNCVLLINGSTDGIYLRASQLLVLDICNSLKITTDGIQYNWIAREA